jgi:hypothetical protein
MDPILTRTLPRKHSVLGQLLTQGFGIGSGLRWTYIVGHVSHLIICSLKRYLTGTRKDPTEYLHSIAEKEIEWTQLFGKPLELDFPHNTVFPGEKLPDDYLALLRKYLTLVPYLLPKDGGSRLNSPTIRRPGMSYPSRWLKLSDHQDLNPYKYSSLPKLAPYPASLTGSTQSSNHVS